MHRIPATLTLVLMLAALCAAGQAAPKVAFMYSSWGEYGFRSELDDVFAGLGWGFEKFENTQIGELAPRLGEFDVVFAGGVANYEHTQDMTAYREQWLGLLNAGGCLIVTDASYGSALDSWVNTFGPEYALTTATCIALKQPTPEGRAVTVSEDGLMRAPNDLAPLLAKHPVIWAHLDSWGEGWRSMVTCRDGRSLFVARPVGKGLLIVTSQYSFSDMDGKRLAGALLENLWAALACQREGLSVQRLELGAGVPGPKRGRLSVRNSTEGTRTLRVRVDVEGPGGVTVGAPVQATLAPGEAADLAVPFALEVRGKVAERLVIEGGDGARIAELPRVLEVPPLMALTLKRKHVYPANPVLESAVKLAPEENADLGRMQVEWVVDETSSAVEGVDGLEAPLAAKLPTGGLPEGTHALTARLMEGTEVIGEAKEEFVIHGTPRVGLRADGATLVDGEPFFPFGFYHVSWGFDAAHRQRMLRDMAAGGFNACHVGIKGDELESFGAFLDEAAALGVKVCLEFGLDPGQVIERYRGHPAMLSWNPGDEPDGQGVAPAEMFARYDRFKALDPDRLVYTTMCVPATYDRYVRGTDVAAPDPYPVPFASVKGVYSLLSDARREAARWDSTVWGVLQCFGNYGPWTRPPSGDELRVMTCLGLLAQIKGIIYYTYADNGWQVRENPEQWEAAVGLAAAMKPLSPALLDGRFTLVCADEGGLYAGYWDYQGARYVVAANAGEAPADLSVAVQGGTAQALLGGQAAIADGKLTASLAPMGSLMVVVR